MSKNSLYLMIFINRANLLHQYYFHFKKVVNMIVPAFVLRGIHVLAQKCLGLDRDFKFTELILKH